MLHGKKWPKPPNFREVDLLTLCTILRCKTFSLQLTTTSLESNRSLRLEEKNFKIDVESIGNGCNYEFPRQALSSTRNYVSRQNDVNV